MSFSQKQISVTIGGHTLSNLRMSVIVEGAGGMAGATAVGAIYGLTLSTMNALTVITYNPNYVSQKPISVSAGDSATGVQLIFSGTVWWAAMDGQNQPNVCFRFHATGNGAPNAMTTEPTSFKGKVPVTQMLQKLSGKAGLSFENSGISAMLNNPYFPGSVGHQIRQICQHAGVEHIIEKGVLAVWNPGQGRQTGGGVVISPQTGMVGYPTFTQAGLVVKSKFRPELGFAQIFTVQSDYQPACGSWINTHITHEIECLMPNGQWFTVVEGQSPGGEAAPTSF
jgi:hypothetical protein